MKDATYSCVNSSGSICLSLSRSHLLLCVLNTYSHENWHVSLFFWPNWWHVDIPQPGIKPPRQQWLKPLPWPHGILNLLYHRRIPHGIFKFLLETLMSFQGNLWFRKVWESKSWSIVIWTYLLEKAEYEVRTPTYNPLAHRLLHMHLVQIQLKSLG